MSEYECKAIKTSHRNNMTGETLKIISNSGTKLVKVTHDSTINEVDESGIVTKNERVLETETIDEESEK